jgi:hypothetical protein
MTLKTKWIAVLAILFVAFGMGACELEEECDPATDPDCQVADAGGDTGGTDAGGDVQQFQTYNYVLVMDLEDPDTAGVDLDAIALIAGGSTFYADDWHECILGPGIEAAGVTTTVDCNQALGPPNNQAGECTGSDTFYVNLGGTGGSIVVSFDGLREIATGNQVRVYDCGRVPDEYSIRVGVGTQVSDPDWVTCTPSASGVGECTVPNLPPVPIN